MTGTMLTESSRLMRGAKLNPPIYLPELRSEHFSVSRRRRFAHVTVL